MMFRAVLCILALGIDTTGAFQASRSARWAKSTRVAPAMSTAYDPTTYAPATEQSVRVSPALLSARANVSTHPFARPPAKTTRSQPRIPPYPFTFVCGHEHVATPK